MPSKTRAFTCIEVIAALAIIALALVALIRLQLISINLTDRTETTTRAVLLAEEKMAQLLAHPWPKLETNSGAEQRGARELHWQTEVTDLDTQALSAITSDLVTSSQTGIRTYSDLSSLNRTDLAPLRRLRVIVNWYEHRHQKQIHLTNYAAHRNTP